MARGNHCCPNIFILFARPTSVYCAQYVYIHTYMTVYRLYMNYRCYQITLQWNIFTQIGAVRSVHWKFDTGVPVWRWMGQYLTSDGTFCNPRNKPLTTAPQRETDELPLASTRTVAVFFKDNCILLLTLCRFVSELLIPSNKHLQKVITSAFTQKWTFRVKWQMFTVSNWNAAFSGF